MTGGGEEMVGYYLKDPQAVLDYAFDWGAGYLGGRAIGGAVWAVLPVETGGVAVVSSAIEGERTLVSVGGGLAGHVYRLSCRISLSDATADERTITLRVEER